MKKEVFSLQLSAVSKTIKPFNNSAINHSTSGFTLVEILIAMSIIALLFAISIGTYASVQKRGRDAKRQSDIKVIQSYLEQYHADQNFYPAQSAGFTLPLSTPDAPLTSAIGQPPLLPTITPRSYLNKVPTDPVTSVAYGYLSLPTGCDNTGSGKYCTTYKLCATLDLPPIGSTCDFGSGFNYQVTSP